MRVTFDLVGHRGREPWTVEVRSMVNAGWAGRDTAAVTAHIEEMKAVGVAPPARVPLTFALARFLLTQGDSVEVYSPESSGEVEYVLVVTGERIGITVGSDHTDRQVEGISVELSKRICPNVVASTVWDLEEVASHVDDLRLRAWVRDHGQWVLYQDAPLGQLLPSAYWLDRLGPRRAEPGAIVFFSGTVATVDGVLRYGNGFRMSLDDPRRGRAITHEYAVHLVNDPWAEREG